MEPVNPMASHLVMAALRSVDQLYIKVTKHDMHFLTLVLKVSALA